MKNYIRLLSLLIIIGGFATVNNNCQALPWLTNKVRGYKQTDMNQYMDEINKNINRKIEGIVKQINKTYGDQRDRSEAAKNLYASIYNQQDFHQDVNFVYNHLVKLRAICEQWKKAKTTGNSLKNFFVLNYDKKELEELNKQIDNLLNKVNYYIKDLSRREIDGNAKKKN